MKYLLDTDTLSIGLEKIGYSINIKHFDRIEKLKIENWLTN